MTTAEVTPIPIEREEKPALSRRLFWAAVPSRYSTCAVMTPPALRPETVADLNVLGLELDARGFRFEQQ